MNSRNKPTGGRSGNKSTGGRSGNQSKKTPLSKGKSRTGKPSISKEAKGKGRYIDFKESKRKGDPLPNFNDNEIRLNKFLSNAGICSRREADVLIETGVVTVNGEIITEMGYKVKPGDQIRYDGATINAETKRYVLLNKPKGFITTMDDPMGRKTVMGLVRKACKERVYPVGRLDRETTGLLLFTNDGDLAKKLTHPRFKAGKIYEVELDKNVTSSHLKMMVEGIQLEDGTTRFDAAEFLDDKDGRLVGVELHSGKNRVVRRAFEALGYKVRKLDRVTFAGLTKKDLPRGRYRSLSEKEVSFLKMTPNA